MSISLGPKSVLLKQYVKKKHFVIIVSGLSCTDTFAKYIKDALLVNNFFKNIQNVSLTY